MAEHNISLNKDIDTKKVSFTEDETVDELENIAIKKVNTSFNDDKSVITETDTGEPVYIGLDIDGFNSKKKEPQEQEEVEQFRPIFTPGETDREDISPFDYAPGECVGVEIPPEPSQPFTANEMTKKKSMLLEDLYRFHKKKNIPLTRHYTMNDTLDNIQIEYERVRCSTETSANLDVMISIYKNSFVGIEFFSNMIFGRGTMDGYAISMTNDFDKNYDTYEEAFIEILRDFYTILPNSPYAKVVMLFVIATMNFVVNKHILHKLVNNGGEGIVNDLMSKVMNNLNTEDKKKMPGPSKDIDELLATLSESDDGLIRVKPSRRNKKKKKSDNNVEH
jgi:hypothetical protein